MALNVQTFKNFVDTMTSTLSNSTAKVTNLRSGSVALAIIQAVAANALSLQQMLVSVYNTCRLATSTGADVDSFVGDWGMTRLPAGASDGLVTITRQLTTNELTVAPGGICQTPTSGIQFQLIADATGLANWDSVRQVYFFPPGVNSISARVQAVVAGSAGNVSANTITQMVSGFVGVNSISNPANFVNGSDQETDGALKLRFVKFVSSLATADLSAIEAAIESVQPNSSYQIIEYKHFDGTAWAAGFTIVADDGTGNASLTFINGITTAVEAVRAAGAEFAVQKPTNVPINVAVTISTASPSALVATQNAVTQALTKYVNTLGVGNTVSYVLLANVIQTTSGVLAYSGLTVNGGTTDIAITQTQLAQIGTVTYV